MTDEPKFSNPLMRLDPYYCSGDSTSVCFWCDEQKGDPHDGNCAWAAELKREWERAKAVVLPAYEALSDYLAASGYAHTGGFVGRDGDEGIRPDEIMVVLE